MSGSTSIPHAPFPSTLWSQVVSIEGLTDEARRERMHRLIERYWRPVYHAARHHPGVSEDEARDLTQEFFLHILEGGVLPGVDRRKGSFRHYLKGALRNFLLNQWRKGNSLKRGGGETILSLDYESVIVPPAGRQMSPDETLDQEWGLQLLGEAVADLDAELARDGRAAGAEMFRAHELADENERPTYAELAERFKIDVSDVEAVLKGCRRRLRRILMEKMSAYVRNEAELADELRELFGI